MLKPCLDCGRLSNRSRCELHRKRERSTPGRTGWQQKQFRVAVLAAAGGRCQAIEDGQRCEQTERLEAHHLDALRDHGKHDPARGVALCRRHHHQVEAAPAVL